MRTARITVAVAATLGLLLAGSPASAASRLNCVKTKDSSEFLGRRAHAENTCAGTVSVKFVINNDFDSDWRDVAKDKKTSWGYQPLKANLDRVLIKYKGKEYVNEH
ncbi:hypothetical protein NLX83_30455 [Allokutzneria sp. A3M-2-11 16]|uniref:hypothetical protein n=1 Tax=Allokutzneria sp. A3M-2-11 16 TaxID=2962043 RepID=UPI0020B6CB02|nr:hypothetical protein [Allokutzneria sp. A3M-2-11 16]MCP3803602.1 hypothetical protein [Allokutzneria sp. A3M-2-11 16]